jgi:hypothetical protein
VNKYVLKWLKRPYKMAFQYMNRDSVLKCLKRPQKKVFVYALRTIFEAVFRNCLDNRIRRYGNNIQGVFKMISRIG